MFSQVSDLKISCLEFFVIIFGLCFVRVCRLSVNKTGATKAGKKSKKAAKDPNKPKRPASAFFVFM